MVEILYRLKNNGRVGIVLPDGFLEGTDNTKVAIKKKLLNDCNIHTIIRLPNSVFKPYASVPTNLLFFDKTTSTNEIWYYRFDLPDGYKAFSKTKPVELKHLDCVVNWWNNREEIQDTKTDESLSITWKSKKITLNDIIENNYNMDFCGYPLKEEVILTPKETMQYFINTREKLEKELDSKIEEILQLLGEEL